MPFYYTFRGKDEETRRIARDFLALNVCSGFDVDGPTDHGLQYLLLRFELSALKLEKAVIRQDGVVLRSAEVGSGQDPLRLPNR